MITVAVVGSREYPMLGLVEARIMARVERHGRDAVRFVSGGAHGVDTRAKEACDALRVPCEVIEPDYARYGKVEAPKIRNGLICAQAQQMDAFWSKSSPGTPHCVELALAKGIPVFVFGPRGERVDPQDCIRWLDRHRASRQRPAQRSAA